MMSNKMIDEAIEKTQIDTMQRETMLDAITQSIQAMNHNVVTWSSLNMMSELSDFVKDETLEEQEAFEFSLESVHLNISRGFLVDLFKRRDFDMLRYIVRELLKQQIAISEATLNEIDNLEQKTDAMNRGGVWPTVKDTERR